MVTMYLDVHKECCQACVAGEGGQILLERRVQTEREALRGLLQQWESPRRVVFEEGPLSGLLRDWLGDLAVEVVSSDPTHNALIALAEDSNDERDAQRLGVLDRAGALRAVYIPAEPMRSLRSLLTYDVSLVRDATRLSNRAKALCRRHGVRYRRSGLAKRESRNQLREQMGSAAARWQLDSLLRQLDLVRRERVAARRLLKRLSAKVTVIERLQSIPGVGPTTALTLVAWLVDPGRFRTRNALVSYAGLGLGQGVTSWRPVGPAQASRRGQRMVKRILFLASRGAITGNNEFAERYQRRVKDEHWEDRKAIRDVARHILLTIRAVWIQGGTYNESLARRSPGGAG